MKGKEEEEEANRFPSANHCPCFDIARLINMEVDERRRKQGGWNSINLLLSTSVFLMYKGEELMIDSRKRFFGYYISTRSNR